MASNMVAALGAGTDAARVILIAYIISDNGHLNGVSKFLPYSSSKAYFIRRSKHLNIFFHGNLTSYTLTVMGTALGLL